MTKFRQRGNRFGYGAIIRGPVAIAPALLLALVNPALAQDSERTLADERPQSEQLERVAQTSAMPVQITGVQINTSETGVQIQLETAGGELSTPTATRSGNDLVIDIPKCSTDAVGWG